MRALRVRSAIVQPAIRDSIRAPRQAFRPESIKYMTIEMDQPFVWPEEPENYEPWGKEEKVAAEKDAEGADEGGKSKEMMESEGSMLREQARELLVRGGLEGWKRERTDKRITADEGAYKVRV